MKSFPRGQPEQANNSKESAIEKAWARTEVTLRLSDRRRALLKALGSDSPTPLAPTAAIDNAIELATQAARRREEVGQHEELASEWREFSSQADRRAAEMQAALREIEARLEDLSDSIASLSREGFDSSAPHGDACVPIRAWLDREAEPLPKRSFLASARWQSTSRIDDERAAIELRVERVAAADLKGQAARGLPAIVRLSAVPMASLFVQCDRMGPFYLMCRGESGAGWNVALHASDENRRPGPNLDSIEA